MDPVPHTNNEWIKGALHLLQENMHIGFHKTHQRLETMEHTISRLASQVQLLSSKQWTTIPLVARPTPAVPTRPALSGARPTPAVPTRPALSGAQSAGAVRPTPAVPTCPALLGSQSTAAVRPTPAVPARPALLAARPTPAVPARPALSGAQSTGAVRTTQAVPARPALLAAQSTPAVWQTPAVPARPFLLVARPTPAVSAPPASCLPPEEHRLLHSQVCPSTSDKGKRKLDLQGESSNMQSPTKRRHVSETPSYTGLKSVIWRQTRGSWSVSLVKLGLEWKDELWSAFNLLRDNAAQENDEDEDYHDTVEKLSALYGEEWKGKSPETLMDDKYFREIPEFLHSKRKTLTCESAQELSAILVKYTRNESQAGEEVKRRYWPLVKCVTVRVPNDLLEHVTLVDLPGNGDRNKSRDEMWKGVVGSCSTVWIVTEINRAASEKESWEILKDACSLMGNGGQCQQIHFICTKSDDIGDSDDYSAGGVQDVIFKRNEQAKKEVKKEFNRLTKVKKHFSDDCLKVFTVSSKEFLKKKHLNPKNTEIPKLREFLQNLNDCHSETLNYVSGARGILSLIQGARCREVKVAVQKTVVCKILEEKMRHELVKVTKPMEEAEKAFEKCLRDGVENSKSSCEKDLKSDLYPRRKTGSSFHGTLKCVVVNNGTHKPKKGKQINLNVTLASRLTDSIDEEFKKTFPNERKCAPFKGAINTFSLDTERLIQEYKDVELQLVFLKTEEEKIKTKLNKMIRERKKTIYSSLTTTIEKTMQECYKKAATFKGQDTLKNMRETIERHLYHSKNIMFQEAKHEMLTQLRVLKEDILKTLEETMQKSIKLSLQADGESIPDFTVELDKVKRYYNKLNGSQMKTGERERWA